MPSDQRQRARRDERVPDPPPIRLTERDLDVIQAVYEYRVLTTQHLQALFFPSVHRAYERLSALYQHGFLDRRFLGVYIDKMNTPILYVLDKRGAEVLQAQRGIEVEWSSSLKQVSTQFLEHGLAINQVRIAFTLACRAQAGFELVRWRGENDLKADYDRVTIRTATGRSETVSLIPDSYFVLNTPLGVAHFFLELDRGSMATKRFGQKVAAYIQYYRSGVYQQRYQTKSLRVLTVTISPTRLDNLKRVTEGVGGEQRFWFTTLDTLTTATVLRHPIWQVATLTAPQALIN